MIQTKELLPGALDEAAGLIRGGSLVVFPTETVYGLGANALDEQAVQGIFQAKGRPQDNPLIVHIGRLDALSQVAASISDLAHIIFREFCPGPITVIVPRHPQLTAAVSAGLPSVGVRIPALGLARDFLNACAVPVAAPSANRSGRPSPTDFRMAWSEMAGRVGAIIHGEACTVGLESTIVWPEGDACLHILRPGAIDPDMLRRVLDSNGLSDTSVVFGNGQDATTALPKAPGTRYRHYSPRARVHLWGNQTEYAQLLNQFSDIENITAFLPEHWGQENHQVSKICRFADLGEYSRHLYRWLVEADERQSPMILAYLPAETAQTLALRDRLTRAGGKIH